MRSSIVKLTRVPVARFGRVLMAVLACLCLSNAQADEHWEFPIRFSKELHSAPFTGRVYVILTKQNRDPRLGPGWFTPEQFVSKEVADWMPGETLLVSDSDTEGLLSYPAPLEKLDLRGYLSRRRG